MTKEVYKGKIVDHDYRILLKYIQSLFEEKNLEKNHIYQILYMLHKLTT